MTASIFVAAVLALGAGLVAGCGEGGTGGADAGPFEGTPWVLASGVDLPQDAALALPTALFESGTVSGSTGCNRYSGQFTVDGDALELGPLAQTQMACAPPADRIERDYVAKFDQVTGWRVDDDRLVLVGDDDTELLQYRPATLVGSWVATGILTGDAFSSPLEGTELTATFGTEDELSGSAGCNRYTASYTATGGAIELTPPSATRMACQTPDGVMEQETTYLALLAEAASFQSDGRTLELLNADGTRLVSFVSAAAP